jgi:hypothetical protein
MRQRAGLDTPEDSRERSRRGWESGGSPNRPALAPGAERDETCTDDDAGPAGQDRDCTVFRSKRNRPLAFTPPAAERADVKHIILQANDVPVAPFLMDRRRIPDRRSRWRGGRRDSDWLNRPLGAWDRIADRSAPPARWKQALASLHLW